MIVLCCQPTAAGRTIENYKVCFCACTPAGDSQYCIGLRSFTLDKKPKRLVVDPRDLSTRIIDSADARSGCDSLSHLRRQFASTAYAEALDSAEGSDGKVQDAGLIHGFGPEKGIDLTVDLCPSSRPLDRNFFIGLITQFEPEEKPIPVAIAVTGNWMFEHPDDLEWLVELQNKGDLAITWINHSYNHRTYGGVPLTENFLLSKGTNLDIEVLKTERKMIEHGLTPSVFFRFPGLVSDSLVFTRITRYGLVPVGSDAWLAKNQAPKNGSIVLVHANGNEPYGIRQFFKLVREHRDSIKAGTWMLYDLRKSIAREVPGR